MIDDWCSRLHCSFSCYICVYCSISCIRLVQRVEYEECAREYYAVTSKLGWLRVCFYSQIDRISTVFELITVWLKNQIKQKIVVFFFVYVMLKMIKQITWIIYTANIESYHLSGFSVWGFLILICSNVNQSFFIPRHFNSTWEFYIHFKFFDSLSCLMVSLFFK